MKMKAVRKDDGIRFFYGNSKDGESMGISTSSAMISVVQMRADQLQKEFQEHRHRISSDRMVSMEKGVNGGDRTSLRGKLYDKYMEKRVARLRMEQGSKRASLNEAKLMALRDDLERCRMELQGMVVSSKDVGLGARQRLQSINVWSSQMTEEVINDLCIHPSNLYMPLEFIRSFRIMKQTFINLFPSCTLHYNS